MRKFSKVVPVFVGTTEGSETSFIKKTVLHHDGPHMAVDKDYNLVEWFWTSWHLWCQV